MNPIFEDTIFEKAYLNFVKDDPRVYEEKERVSISFEIKSLDTMINQTLDNMQFTVDERLIDYYIYTLKALSCKREYLTDFLKRHEV